jgi:hypothetical protein
MMLTSDALKTNNQRFILRPPLFDVISGEYDSHGHGTLSHIL